MIRRLVVALALAASLPAFAGCQAFTTAYNTVTQAEVSPKNIYYVRVGLRTAIETATLYVELPSCRGEQTFVSSGFRCSEDAVVAKLAPAEQVAYQAQKDLDEFVRTHPGELKAQGVYDAARTAYNTLTNIINVYHLGGPS